MTETNKTLAKRKPNELRDLIEGPDFRLQLLKALPNAMSPERFVRITVTSMMRNPKLMQCSRETFFRCLLDLSAMGLEPDGRQAHLIPRKNKHTNAIDCTLIIDYKGIKELLYRNGDIVDEHSDVVGDLDAFEYEFGSNKHLRHVPHTRDRGKLYCAYSFITLPKGGTAFDVMSTEEIETVRRRSANPDGDPWTKDWSEMAKKTVFKRLAKSLPLSPKTRDAIEMDNTYEVERESAPIQPLRAVVGGTRQNLPPEEPDAYEEPPELAPDDRPPTEISAEEPTSPPEPVSEPARVERPLGPLQRVRGLLKEAGFTAGELLALLKTVNMVDPGMKDLGLVPPVKLREILGDWDNCVRRLELEREAAKNPTPAKNQPVSSEELPL
jgi:recombination protein RecT